MAEFWIRNTTVAEYTINDLGMTLPASGEIDLHVHFSYDDIQRSSSLDTALSTGDLVRLDGEGGSTIPYADAYDDAVAPHEISGDAHTGSLDTDAVTEGDNLYYTEGRVSANTDVTANTSHRGSTSNPHTVTATQLSLNNVTNDAQLKRAAADISTFTEKTTPVSADLLLIEDSAATNAKESPDRKPSRCWSCVSNGDTNFTSDHYNFNYVCDMHWRDDDARCRNVCSLV